MLINDKMNLWQFDIVLLGPEVEAEVAVVVVEIAWLGEAVEEGE